MTYRQPLLKEPVVSNYFVKENKRQRFKNNMSVFFPAGTFEDFNMNFDVKRYTIFLMRRPLFTPVLITMRIVNMDAQKEKYSLQMSAKWKDEV
jgi:hypothetical protein